MVSEYIDVLKNDNFLRIAELIRVCTSTQWSREHPSSKSLFHFNNLYKAVKSKNQSNCITHYSLLVADAIEHDINLTVYHTTTSLDWFVKTLDQDNYDTIFMMLFAVASCETEYITPVEASKISGMSESHWRNSAKNISNAKKMGKQWLIPKLWVEFNLEGRTIDGVLHEHGHKWETETHVVANTRELKTLVNQMKNDRWVVAEKHDVDQNTGEITAKFKRIID